MRLGILGGVVVVACSSSPATSDGGTDASVESGADAGPYSGPDYASGSRLRAEVYTSADGAKMWHGWFDQQLGTTCEYDGTDDGATRCVPFEASWANAFADASCQEPLLVQQDCGAPDAKYAVDATATCGAIVYQTGAKLGALTTIYTNPGCQPQTVNGGIYYAVGAKLDPGILVKGTLERDARGADLSMQFTVGDDGSRQPLQPYDTKRKGTCATMGGIAYTPNADRCVPQHVGYFEFQYSDPGCTSKAAVHAFAGGCDPQPDDVPTAAWVYEVVQCQGATLPTVNEMGAQTTGPLYQDPTACTLNAAAPADWFPIQAPIDATTLPAIGSTQVGQGRVVENWQIAASQDRLFVDGFYDTTLSTKCYAQPAADGSLRCAPDVPSVNTYYADDQCTSPVVAWSTPSGCPPTSPPATILVESNVSCVEREAYATVGSKLVTPSTLWQQNGGCMPTTPDPTGDYYAVTIVDPTTLAPLTDVRE